MENAPFTDDFPSYKPPFIMDFPYAMSNNQMVYEWYIGIILGPRIISQLSELIKL
jgi:hypothetical protein